MIDVERLTASLKLHEGVRLKLYWDSAQPPRATIGVGHNLSDNGISAAVCDAMLIEDIESAQRECAALPWFAELDTVRQNAITELMFNLGAPRLAGFKKMIAAIRVGDWPSAAYELIHSAWAVQVGPKRAGTLSNMIRYGVWP